MKWKNFQYCPNCGSYNPYMVDDPSKIRDCATCKHYNTEDKDIPFCDILDKSSVECVHRDKWEKNS